MRRRVRSLRGIRAYLYNLASRGVSTSRHMASTQWVGGFV